MAFDYFIDRIYDRSTRAMNNIIVVLLQSLPVYFALLELHSLATQR